VAIGLGSGEDPGSTCNHQPGTEIYEVITDTLINFKFLSPEGGQGAAAPLLNELEQDKIVFVGEGGCGETAKERISILTRVVGN